MPQSISVLEIQTLFQLIVQKLKNDGIENVSLDHDEYWHIPIALSNDFEKVPEPYVGSLVDDIKSLKVALSQGEIFTYNHLDSTATLLKFISEQQAPSI